MVWELINNNPVLVLIILTFIPALELRASIPYGIFKTDLHWSLVFLICVAANIVLGPVVYVFIDKFMNIFMIIKPIEKLYKRIVIKTQKKIHPYIERYGLVGLSVFIGIPLPGSGSYTGAIGGYFLGFSLKRFILANVLGVLIAGVVVLIISLTGSASWSFFIKTI